MLHNMSHMILRGLIEDKGFADRYLPHLSPDLWTTPEEKVLFKAIKAHMESLDTLPTVQTLTVDLNHTSGGEEHDDAIELLPTLPGNTESREWLDAKTEAWIAKRTQETAMMNIITALTENKPVAPHIEKLSTPVSFSNAVEGIGTAQSDWLDRLYDHNHQTDSVIPFDIDFLNTAVRGVRRGTLNVVIAPTNVGKSLCMCHLSAAYLRQGLNVLYLSLEMDEMTCVNRIFANLFDVTMSELETMTKAEYKAKAAAIGKIGTLFVRDFPTGAAGVGHFKAHIASLKEKAGFVPDVICVDYLNICSSDTKSGNNNPHYLVVGSIAKELRGMAKQLNVAVWTATQANRSGMGGKKVDLTHTSDSIHTAYDADLVLALWRDEELADTLHVAVEKQRNGSGAGKHGIVTVNTAKMRLYDPATGQTAQVKAALQNKANAKGASKSKAEVVFEIDVEAA